VIYSADITGAVTCIKVRHNDQECVSASSDGTCIIWDLVLVIVHYSEIVLNLYKNRRFVRNQVIFANTLFRAVCYRPDECQIITGGTDRKVKVLLMLVNNQSVPDWILGDA